MTTNEFAKRVARLEKALRVQQSRQTAALAGRYPDPVEYARAVLRVEPIPVIQNVLRSLTQPPFKTLVKSGHNIGKSHAAAIAINWFFDTFAPCAVISTAPTQRDVCDVLWKEVRMQRQRAGLPDDFVGGAAPHMRTGPDHYAKGFTARLGESLQGRHDLRMLFVMDEAVGISPIFWHTFKSMFRAEAGHAWLAICNPTDTASEAYQQESDAVRDKSWHMFTLSALEHPNIERELRGEPPLIPAAVSLQQVHSWVADWCEPIRPETEEIRKTDLEWPPGSGRWYRPGPVFQCRAQGQWPTLGSSGVWSDALWERATTTRLEVPKERLPEIGCDVAYHGMDYTSIFVRWGPCGMSHEEANGWDHVRTANRLTELAQTWADKASSMRYRKTGLVDPKQIPIKVDDDGTGGGVVSLLRSEGYAVVPVGAGTKASRAGWYPNKRSELWFEACGLARAGQMDLTRLPQDTLRRLRNQAMVVEWSIDPLGQRVVEPKDIIKKKCGRSPDSMDALNLAWYTSGLFEAPIILDEPRRVSLHERVFGKSPSNRLL